MQTLTSRLNGTSQSRGEKESDSCCYLGYVCGSHFCKERRMYYKKFTIKARVKNIKDERAYIHTPCYRQNKGEAMKEPRAQIQPGHVSSWIFIPNTLTYHNSPRSCIL